MAISHVAAIGSNGSKSTGTTLAVTATPGTQPAVGDLIVVACARDDIANEPLTGDSCSDGHGNTYSRLVYNGGAASTNPTAGDSIIGVIFYSVLTVAWSGATTVTWTHASLDARGMQVEHFAPTSGYTIFLQEQAPGAFQSTGTSSVTAQLVNPTIVGDLTFGAVGVATDSTSAITGDTDTNGGASWSSITANAGTSGGTAATNVFVATQYKTGQTDPAVQGYNVTGFTSAASIAMAASFHEIATTGVVFIGAGGQVAYNGATISPPVPPAATTNDLLLMVIGGRPSSSSADGISIAGGTDGWAQHGTTSYLAVAAADDASVQLWWKLHDGSESAPTVTANTVLTATGGYSAQILAFRRIDRSTPFDVTPVNSNSAAAATWAPTAVTTATTNAMAVSAVASADDNALNFNTSQGFTMMVGGADFDTTNGTDHSVAAAYKIISAPGSVTQPTWNQSVNGNDAWVGIATALKSPDASAFPGAGAATGTANNATTTTAVSAPAGAASATGAANNPTTMAAGNASAGTASASAVANDAAAQVSTTNTDANAGSASATGAANQPTLTIASAASAGTAAATGSAFNASPSGSMSASAGTASGAGTANAPNVDVSQPAGTASASGAADNPAIGAASTASPASATGTGVAFDASASGSGSASAGAAAAAGVAFNPTASGSGSVSAGTATASGTAFGADVSAASTAAAGSASAPGTAFNASVTSDGSAAAGSASSTGTGYNASAPTSVIAAAGAGAGLGAASNPTTGVYANAGIATAAGTASNPAVTAASTAPAGHASAVGAALQPSVTVDIHAGIGVGTGTASGPALAVAASSGAAAAAGVAFGAVAFTVNGVDPTAFTFLVLRDSSTWARVAPSCTSAEVVCASTLAEMETVP